MNVFANKVSYRAYFSFLFLIFGAIIALLTSVVNYSFDVRNIQAELDDRANSELIRKSEELASFTEIYERYVATLRNSSALHTFIQQPTEENRTIANQLFYAISSTNSAFMQVRFLDTHGMETIRVDRDIGRQWPEIIPGKELQDKGQRYYFMEAAQAPANSFWYSKLDLNIEHKKIEIPIKPVLRIASPVYVNQQFKGIVIVNIHAKEFLQKFKESPFFNIALIDHDGHYILHYQEELSWSRYLQTGHTLTTDYPDLAAKILHGKPGQDIVSLGPLFAADLTHLLKKDQAHLLLIPKNKAVQGMKDEQQQAMFLIIGTILLLSIPVAILISKIPTKLSEKVDRQKAILESYVDLIDRNIITASTCKEGLFTEVSTAFCQVSGYTKSELVGKNLHLLQHSLLEKNDKDTLWQSIKTDQTWSGELQNRTKNGASYWTDMAIFPNYSEQKQINGYTAIYKDTTDKKQIEKLSITDVLTGLYNRRFFNDTIAKELGRAMRDKKTLGFAMLDVDFFKQYNDHYGHQKGDEVLSAIGQTLQQSLCRSSDFCFRLGGEEFGIIFSGLSPEQGFSFIESIRIAIESLALEHRWGCPVNVVTASFGLITIPPSLVMTVDTIYQKADQALYTAKEEGRNRICVDLLSQRT